MIQKQPQKKRPIPRETVFRRDPYLWYTYAPEETGIRLICVEDETTHTIVSTTTANPERRIASLKAWAGARHSRSAGMPWDILVEMEGKGVNPDQKLEETFRGYGHASVGDMARLMVDFSNVPMHACFALFGESSLNSGQEKSTRYQSAFGKATLHPIKHYLSDDLPKEEIADLEQQYQALGSYALNCLAKHKERLSQAFIHFYQIDMADPVQKSALASRVLDCTRSFLLLGQSTGMSLETSARDWSRLIASLKAAPVRYYHQLARQLETLLSPSSEEEAVLRYLAEAPGLIRHTSPRLTVNRNLQMLKQYLLHRTDVLQCVPIARGAPQYEQQRVRLLDPLFTAGDRLIAHYLLLLWPGLERSALLEWIHRQEEETKRQISAIVYADHTPHNEVPGFAQTTSLTLVIESFLGEARDFNRHRAWGRFSALPLMFGEPPTYDTITQLLARGFGLPAYLTEVPAFMEYRRAFEQDLFAYYTQLQEFLEQVAAHYHETIDYAFVLNLLPLAHRVDLWMHGDPKQALYLTQQRSRPGGHINYRLLAYEANQLIARSDPYQSSISLPHKPDPTSREEFLDRS